jgi:hypothetical protein
MNVGQTAGASTRRAEESRSIAWPDCNAERALAQKTRRAVRDEVISTQERRARQRHNLGWALMGFGFMLLLLAPAMWSGLEDLLAGEHLFDLPALVTCLILMLFTAIFAALIAVWRSRQAVEHDRGGFETFRPIQK